MKRFAAATVVAAFLVSATATVHADVRGLGTKPGTAELKSAGPLTFGNDGVLFIGDPVAAAIVAVQTGDNKPGSTAAALEVEGIDEKIAALLGTTASEVMINDLAINPISKAAYLSVSRGRGPQAAPVILTLNGDGQLKELDLRKLKATKSQLPNPPEAGNNPNRNPRVDVITSMVFLDGKLYVAGLSNEEFASRLRVIPYPFSKVDEGTSVEIYHGAHGRFETRSPIRTFVPFTLEGEANLIAAYTCTPLVKFPVSKLTPGSHLKGTTIAELGNRNRPLDMVVYKKDGKDWILMANSSRGVMKIPTTGMEKAEGITDPVRGGGTKGVGYETIESLKGVLQLAQLDNERGVVLVRNDAGKLNLSTITLP